MDDPAAGTAANAGGDDLQSSLRGDDYELADVYTMTSTQAAAIRRTAANAWSIIRAAAPIARALPDEILADFGIPANARDLVRMVDPAAPETLVGRFDFIETPAGYRVMEFNAETPFFIIETHASNGAAVGARGMGDPNAGCEEQLARTIAGAIGAAPDTKALHVAIAAHDTAAEDRVTAEYLRTIVGRATNARVTFAPLRTLRVHDNGLWSDAGRIDVLYRLYPLELLAADRAGGRVFDLVRRGALRLLNPASALIAQSKMLMVLIWGLAQRDDIFDERQRRIVREVFLPTFADLPDDGATYVSKCVLGREGDSVAILSPGGARIESASKQYDGQPRVYQQHVPLPRWKARTRGGALIDGYVVTTCFVAGGTPGAIGIRVGGPITDSRAHYAPVGIEAGSAANFGAGFRSYGEKLYLTASKPENLPKT